MLRRITVLFSAVLLLITTAWALPAQAVGVYSRAFTNAYHNAGQNRSMCLWVHDDRGLGYNPYLQSCATSPNALAKFWLHQKEDNWEGSKHPMWVIQSQGTTLTSCLEASPRSDDPFNIGLGTCDWVGEGNNNKQWEAFWMPQYDAWVIKSIGGWKRGFDLCLGAFQYGLTTHLVKCNLHDGLQHWKTGAATPVS
ncbi:hypothetical protein ACGFJ7_23805 [Actinoplanes sp. NPDC048988]|uniref:hypothetical protein n=1 Tax=Actinoplanes sp. NPDC048988 TaxID=3363901 RepID=UPI003719A121